MQPTLGFQLQLVHCREPPGLPVKEAAAEAAKLHTLAIHHTQPQNSRTSSNKACNPPRHFTPTHRSAAAPYLPCQINHSMASAAEPKAAVASMVASSYEKEDKYYGKSDK